jgi:KEOPS complex subunit Pcc1
MSAFNATIVLHTKDKTKAIFDSINTDNKFYPENPTKTTISKKRDRIHVLIESDELSHLRANLNSLLRLLEASANSIESVKPHYD